MRKSAWCSVSLCVALNACTSLPRPVSPAPHPSGQPGLQAGFARVDITPPPFGGLFGYGPEGKNAVGFRTRLYARALVLEDASGERIAFVLTDLGANSVLVHRYVAKTTRRAGIGADRLLLAASHTHAGPTHYFGLLHDLVAAGGNMGFDWAWSMELSRRIAAAVDTAVRGLRPARAGWHAFPVWGVTHSRNIIPFASNRVPWKSPFPTPAGLTPEEAAIDPAWYLLRIDVRDADGVYQPAGALSIFAMHGTGAPNLNDLYDADLPGMVSNAIERGIDRLSGRAPGPKPTAFHLFVQGSEGDASAMPSDTRCPAPTLKNPEEFGPNPVLTSDLLLKAKLWQAPDDTAAARCISRARARMQWVADTLSAVTLREFANVRTTDSLVIRRVFATIYPKDLPRQLCPQPRLGTATLAGPVDGQTRLLGAHVRYIEEGGSAINPEPQSKMARCQAPKRLLTIKMPLLGRLTQSAVYELKLTPREAQLAVVRVGPQVIAALPVEMTTTAGGRIKDTLASVLHVDPLQVAAIGVVNGYLNYLTTADEYAQQHYEGASTLFGPNSAEALKQIVVDLARQLPANVQPSPPGRVGKAYAWGDDVARHRFASARDGPAVVARCISEISTQHDTVSFTLRDWYPGRLLRAPYPLLQFERRVGAAWEPMAWDDDPRVEIRALRPDGKRGYLWSVRWTPSSVPPEWRVTLTKRGANREIRSDEPSNACALTR